MDYYLATSEDFAKLYPDVVRVGGRAMFIVPFEGGFLWSIVQMPEFVSNKYRLRLWPLEPEDFSSGHFVDTDFAALVFAQAASYSEALIVDGRGVRKRMRLKHEPGPMDLNLYASLLGRNNTFGKVICSEE